LTIGSAIIRPLARGSGGDVAAAATGGELPIVKQQPPQPGPSSSSPTARNVSPPPSSIIVQIGGSNGKNHKMKEEYKNNNQNHRRRPPTEARPNERCFSTSKSMIVRTTNNVAVLLRRLDEITIPSRTKETDAIIAWLLSSHLPAADDASRPLPPERGRRMLLVEGRSGGTFHI
jgi:hypothetical protein